MHEHQARGLGHRLPEQETAVPVFNTSDPEDQVPRLQRFREAHPRGGRRTATASTCAPGSTYAACSMVSTGSATG